LYRSQFKDPKGKQELFFGEDLPDLRHIQVWGYDVVIHKEDDDAEREIGNVFWIRQIIKILSYSMRGTNCCHEERKVLRVEIRV
jgi:hypothetical protein